MRPAVSLRNIIGVAENIFSEGFAPLHGYLYFNAIITNSVKMEYRINHTLIGIEVINKGFQATFVVEQLLFTAALIQ